MIARGTMATRDPDRLDREHLVRSLFPPSVAVAVWSETDPLPTLFAEEEALIRNSVEKRASEFRKGRACARRVLKELGLDASPLLPEFGRAPRWPDGVVGSITHCEGFIAAVACMRPVAAGIGIDAESAAPLPDDVTRIVCTERELRATRAGASREDWTAACFSAKESVQKAIYPSCFRLLEFLDVEVDLGLEDGMFNARATRPLPPGVPDLQRIEGRFRVMSDVVVTAAMLR